MFKVSSIQRVIAFVLWSVTSGCAFKVALMVFLTLKSSITSVPPWEVSVFDSVVPPPPVDGVVSAS